MRKYKLSAVSMALLLAMMMLPNLSASAQTAQFANNDFKAAWERLDFIVGTPGAHGYYWGPLETSKVKDETYNGKTLHVQYFDKARMELNEAAPAGDKYRVTTGLLANELISGNHQTGDTTFETRWPADIAIAGDADDANAPTYYSFNKLTGKANNNPNGSATATIARNGTVGADAGKANDPGSVLAYYEPTTGHNIPKAFWDFLNAKGPVKVGGQVTQNQQFSDPWNYITGLPTTEAYWTKVKIAGQANVDVLIQAYERRVVTYVPTFPPGQKVQMGNIGQHYYDWLYNNAGKPATPPPPPANTPQPGPAQPDCSGIPDPKSATITPNCIAPGESVNIDMFGFDPTEPLSFWFTDPHGVVIGTARPVQGGAPGGHVRGELPIPEDYELGIWALTFNGANTHHESIVWFKLVNKSGGGGNGPTPTPGSNADVCSQVPPSQNGSVTPTCAAGGASFQFTGTGFTANQEVRLWLTTPDQAVVPSSAITADGHEIQAYSDASGTVKIGLFTGSAIPKGVWALTFHQLDGHHDSILYFGIK